MARRWQQSGFVMQPGEIIDGKYEVLHTLGEGGMGLVVAAHDRRTGTPVAVKLLRPNIDDETIRKRFLREARNLRKLSSEHVARAFDHGTHHDQPYMVMELLVGHDLASQLERQPLPPRLATNYVAQACLGLADAHALGIVHRDVKPANLMVVRNPDGQSIIKLLDFGIATAARNDLDAALTHVNMIVGSVSYMSPEQLRGERDLDGRSDIWSLGVTLYELLSGRLPFPGDNFAAITIGIATEPHAPLVEAEPALAAIVDRCLAKNPADRYATVEELAAALAPYAGGIFGSPDRPTIRAMPASSSSANMPAASDSGGFHARMLVLPGALANTACTTRTRTRTLVASAIVVALAILGFTAMAIAPSEASAINAKAPVATVRPTPIVEPIVEPIVVPTAPPAAAPTVEVEPDDAEIVIDADEVLADHAQIAKPSKPKRVAKRGAVTKRGKAKRQRIAKACDPRDPRCLL